jgi:hypothetical protein
MLPPLQANGTIQNLLELLPGDAVQVVGAVQSAPVGADLLAVHTMGLAFAKPVIDGSRDEDVVVQLLETVIVVGVTVMEAVRILWHGQPSLDVPGLDGALGDFSNHFLPDIFWKQ